MIRHSMVFLIAVFLFQGGASIMAQVNDQPMTNADVVKMVQSGMPEADIIRAIQAATPNFEITDENVIALQAQKIPEKVILAMIKRRGPDKPVSHNARKPSNHPSVAKSTHKWEFEVHGGLLYSTQTGGWTQIPAAETYSLEGSGAQGYESIRASSWYLGDGAELIGATTSLDTVLTKPIVEPEDRMFGFRVGRALSKWMAAEFTFDRGGRLAMTDESLAEIKAANAAFKKFWQRLDVPGNTPSSSKSSISAYGGRQIFTTGAIVVSLPVSERVVPFFTAGAGVLFSGSSTAGATLEGSYGGPKALETDTVYLTVTQASNSAFTGMAGGGVKVYLTSHLGIRFDVRAYFYQNPMTTLLDATHTNTANSAWVVKAKTRTGAPTAPDLQLLSGPGLEAYSTLSGPNITGLKSFYGYGTQRQIPITVGLFWRL
jgi:hypothetical protein